MSKAELVLKNISKSFPLGNGSELPVLELVNLTVAKGETLAVMGPSGCGKSTLLNIIGTLETMNKGSLEIDGQSVDMDNPDGLADLRLSKIGFVFQKHHLMPQLTALENVLLPTLKKPANDSRQRAVELLSKVGLEDRQHHRPGQLSGGECQRVALCRALINRPSLLLADEPTGALDQAAATMLADLILKMNEDEGLTVIAVTHSQELADKMSKKYRLLNGELGLL